MFWKEWIPPTAFFTGRKRLWSLLRPRYATSITHGVKEIQLWKPWNLGQCNGTKFLYFETNGDYLKPRQCSYMWGGQVWHQITALLHQFNLPRFFATDPHDSQGDVWIVEDLEDFPYPDRCGDSPETIWLAFPHVFGMLTIVNPKLPHGPSGVPRRSPALGRAGPHPPSFPGSVASGDPNL